MRPALLAPLLALVALATAAPQLTGATSPTPAPPFGPTSTLVQTATRTESGPQWAEERDAKRRHDALANAARAWKAAAAVPIAAIGLIGGAWFLIFIVRYNGETRRIQLEAERMAPPGGKGDVEMAPAAAVPLLPAGPAPVASPAAAPATLPLGAAAAALPLLAAPARAAPQFGLVTTITSTTWAPYPTIYDKIYAADNDYNRATIRNCKILAPWLWVVPLLVMGVWFLIAYRRRQRALASRPKVEYWGVNEVVQ
ncbi:hypothetical protein Q8F55_007910 [Vanrija albida]|uniref:Uncharacterized protein n=1 Tax=Vanrija albida TaxID=181172 RepID=A0ABR3PUW4_9TREE